jgi:peptidoglycan/LPS O-acetylase OafA/YrhL
MKLEYELKTFRGVMKLLKIITILFITGGFFSPLVVLFFIDDESIYFSAIIPIILMIAGAALYMRAKGTAADKKHRALLIAAIVMFLLFAIFRLEYEISGIVWAVLAAVFGLFWVAALARRRYNENRGEKHEGII